MIIKDGGTLFARISGTVLVYVCIAVSLCGALLIEILSMV